MKESPKISRKTFVKYSLLAGAGVGLGSLWWSLSQRDKLPEWRVRMVDDQSKIGHKMRDGIVVVPTDVVEVPLLIVGAGVAGMTAAMHLSKSGYNDYTILELGENFGGNATAGANETGAYPWGAHYLPLPNLNQAELIDFLFESNIITGFDEHNLPIYDEVNICFDPEERLFIDGKWRDGMEPPSALSERDQAQLAAFHQLMESYKFSKGKDGKEAFCIPVHHSSKDELFLALDKISMSEFCASKGFDSEYLNWYVNYACLDDYGADADTVSAWAGIHYFASRKGKAANVKEGQCLTWPEGNNRLIQYLQKQIKGQALSHQLVYRVNKVNKVYQTDVYDYKSNAYKRYQSAQIILALPHYVCKRIVSSALMPSESLEYHYYPWLVANMLVDARKLNNSGARLSWDNVVFGKSSLGYVNACHQHLNYTEHLLNLTFYQPIIKGQASESRQWARNQTADDWKNNVLSELEMAHPDLKEAVIDMQCKLWGHAMIAPTKGFISTKLNQTQILETGLYVAHSDQSGISIFEEAFYHGIQAAKSALKNT
ncbi:MAG: NAD(P)-binding protein [Bacteroidetes bacterium]|nr:NAD(P)-binding protein [Bacteroidota bacterium]